MKKSIKNKKSFCLSLLILLSVFLFCIIKFEELFILYPDSKTNFFIISFTILLIYLLYKSAKWKLEFDESGFKLDWESNEEIKYNKIQKVVHYKTFMMRSHVDKFIITYLGEKEFGDGEENKEITLSGFPKTEEMKFFFEQMRQKNPEIIFVKQTASGSGIEEESFDYFQSE